MNRKMQRTAAVLLLILMTAVLAAGCASGAPAEETFIRIDRDDPEAWTRELDNVRFLQEERMSGSAQFSADQLRELADRLRERSENVWIVDCRLESHGLINGIAVSWCNGNNDANAGKTAKKVMAEEKRLSGLTGREVTAWTTEDDEPKDSVILSVETWETEKALTESEGFRYLRLTCPDHCWPPAGVIDEFIAFAADLEEDAWLHFHCQAGSGRTGAFMTIWEMMRRPDASVEEILQHQAETGSGNLLDRAKPEKTHAQKERCRLEDEVERVAPGALRDGDDEGRGGSGKKRGIQLRPAGRERFHGGSGARSGDGTGRRHRVLHHGGGVAYTI